MRVLHHWREQRLLRRIRSGDRQAANHLVDTHYEPVYRWLLRLCHEREWAADLTQETFLQVWAGLDGFESRCSLKTWIHRIAYHTYLRAQRNRGPESAPLREAVSNPGPTEGVLARCAVEQALTQLPEGQQQVVVLHYMQGLTSTEIASALDIPAGTVLSRLHTARARLRELLSNESSPSAQEVHTDVAQK